MKITPTIFWLLTCILDNVVANETIHNDNSTKGLELDKKGYIIFCLCMGRFGNQADHFLGGMKFAKSIDRTLILPPWRGQYQDVPFTDWFRIEDISEFNRAVSAEDFMTNLAPIIWPPGNRTGFCKYRLHGAPCDMKKGNPSERFWNGLGVNFDSEVKFSFSHHYPEEWKKEYPPDKYPVIALKTAPADFPIEESNVPLQKYMKWTYNIEQEAQAYIDRHFGGKKFVGLHLRNGNGWKQACEHTSDYVRFMASPQCTGYNNTELLNPSLCYPSEEEILRLTKKIVLEFDIKIVFVATNQFPMQKIISDHLKNEKVQVYHMDPRIPQLDLIVLEKADHFIGNCVSSFSAFVARARLMQGKPTSYLGYS
ncbi:hypothetical protein ScPMuIL_006345 [Solemya velum]